MKKYIFIILIVITCLIPLLFTATLPYVFPTRLYLNTLKNSEHTRRFEVPKTYVIALEKGSQYTIYVDVSTAWGMDIALKIGDTPYMITGYRVDTDSYTGETMHFTASRTGDYYIQIGVISGSGFFDIRVDSGITNPATGSNSEFFSGIYLIVLILPSVIILSVGLIIFLLINRRKRSSLIEMKPPIIISDKAEEIEKTVVFNKKGVKFCAYCGNEINTDLKICQHCNMSLN